MPVMFSWLEFEILELPSTEYLVLLGALVVAFAYLAYYSYGVVKRYRFVEGTATSKIRSAALGHVELKGLGEWMPNGEIHSPFSNRRCVCAVLANEQPGPISRMNAVVTCFTWLMTPTIASSIPTLRT